MTGPVVAMDKLLANGRVQDVIRSSVNIDNLVPYLVKNELLTPDEFNQFCDRSLDEEKRIDYLITILRKKGDHVKNFINSLRNGYEHTGHRDILRVVNEELVALGLSVDIDAEMPNGITVNSDRKRTHMLGDYERDSGSSKRPKKSQTLPKVVNNFTGRQDLLEQAIESLQPSNSNTRILSIHGLPAAGKSQFVIKVGHHLQQQLNYDVYYHDFVSVTQVSDEFSEKFSDINGYEHQCLILDNIDNLLQQSSAVLSALQHITSRHRIKIITTSCKALIDTDFDIERIRVLPFTETESQTYMQNVMVRYPGQDVTPVVNVCGGIPLALRCAVENINSRHWDIQDFCCDDDGNVFELLYVENFGSQSLNQVKIRFQNKLSLLPENRQENLRDIANDAERLGNLSSVDKRFLYNSGWLEREDGRLFLNGLLQRFVREIFRSRVQP